MAQAPMAQAGQALSELMRLGIFFTYKCEVHYNGDKFTIFHLIIIDRVV